MRIGGILFTEQEAHMKVSELKRLMQKKGCKFNKHNSRHDEWINLVNNLKAQIPRHDSREIPTGTVKRILKDLGLE